MFIIGEAVIEDDVAREYFACDLLQCKGACCTLPGGRGAPLDDDEVAEIRQAIPFAQRYLSAKHLQFIEQCGAVEGVPGSYATVCLDDKDCVFVYYEGSIATCSLEKAYNNGETKWRKPISCHLFPIRISHGSMERVRYEQIRECRPAVERGRTAGIPLYIFLKDALVRKYGEQWYEKFKKACEQHDPLIT